ncbi:hypothetical protein Vretimale_6623 [Volvox reticuliferus]|uniref:Uncharacterized protein n=1 Tax=Volvox reticuliferus TaxID=1737510 RepID=A0A8J4FN97_9CHLO|nr:hypothetical protein Vretifemale_7249 [Volvox reticuliferus]GIM01908.1 hypothetical protein Vretimale_6623 [Volvox reticuliferus]
MAGDLSQGQKMATPNVEGVQTGQIDIVVGKVEKKRLCASFDAFKTFGLLTYFLFLYAIYAGYFAALLFIAMAVRKDNYLHLNKKLTGTYISDNAYTTPWIWLRSKLQ